MSYCRFSEGDVYLYPHVGGGFECCGCSLTGKVATVFTKGVEHHPIFGTISACESCHGEGCDDCMMHGSLRLQTRTECLEHLQHHKEAGDNVPDYAFNRLKEELAEDGEKNDPLFDDGYDGPALFNIKTGEATKAFDPTKEIDNEKD